ncbi:MAG TPA: histidine kinase N-terminal 7TM domain-containing protein [Candidatus Limnocylindria bacterium]|nr:histidine kinase N-terminal 7TM domain-containing protein [Candidatus Limnocylindria bacterium]
MDPELLEIVAHGITAILATWLGLIVLTRAGRQPGARIFSFLTGLLVVWSVAITIQRLSPDVGVRQALNAIEDVAAFLLPAATLHIALSLTVEGRRSILQQTVLVGTYLLSAVVALGAVFFPDQQLAVTPPHFELPGISGEVFGWAWIVVRLLIFAAAHFWIIRALLGAGEDVARRRQLLATLATVFVGTVGGVLRILPGISASDPWIGVSLVTLAMVLAAYAVFAQGVFMSADVAVSAFRYTMVLGLGVTAFVAILIGLERLTQEVLGINFPIVTGLTLVVTIALLGPITEWARNAIRSTSPRERAYDRLLQALGEELLTAQRPESAVVPALARMTRIFKLQGATVLGADGNPVAQHGSSATDDSLALRLPLQYRGRAAGTVIFGAKRSNLPFTAQEAELLSLAAGYLAGSLELAERHDQQATALEDLSAERRAVRSAGSELSEALEEAASAPAGLHVFALGPLRVERDGQPMRRWGGEKAGTRQAEAVFAFLFDRGERGAAKDEFVELIWPDVDLERADLAFHRTLGGLRTTLEPGRRGGDRGAAISFHNDRYRLDPALVSWSDVGAFETAMAAASAAMDPDESLQHLERARSLYRGDFLDDCPFYGDSAQVEERRELLRGRCVDLLLALGERYEARGDRPAAAACFRQARLVAGDELPPADEALTRLGAPV